MRRLCELETPYPMSFASTPSSEEEVGRLLQSWGNGDQSALEKLTPIVYGELRRLARHYMRGERKEITLQTTALVNEAYLRLVDYKRMRFKDRAHFFALASRLMRRVLVDHAKSRARIKRGPGIREPATEDTMPPAASFDVIALDEALESLQRMEPRLAQAIELHYFGGLTYDQIAAAGGASTATVHRDIRLARAWLLNEIAGKRPT